jgi:hypothetical protein
MLQRTDRGSGVCVVVGGWRRAGDTTISDIVFVPLFVVSWRVWPARWVIAHGPSVAARGERLVDQAGMSPSVDRGLHRWPS